MKNNIQIKEYLDYYLGMKTSPEYAVLINGAWGSGKSWFIRKYLDDYEKSEGKYLYVSLYGVNSFEQIERDFFNQLHPLLSSAGMRLTGSILRGILKTAVKIDLDSDGKSDGAIRSEIPEIDFPDYLKDTDDYILVFDDLERCSINVNDILGYINHFVENQGSKVILIANEEEIIKKYAGEEVEKKSYDLIKEKIVGKTYKIKTDLSGALNEFIKTITDKEVREIFESRRDIIANIYQLSQYQNLRHIRQSVLEFDRFFSYIPSKAKSCDELLEHLLEVYFIYSIEIRSGALKAGELTKFINSYYLSKLSENENDQRKVIYKKIYDKYENINLSNSVINGSVWEVIFDEGHLDREELKKAFLNSSYLSDDNKPSWIKLWYWYDLSQDKFEQVVDEVEKLLSEKHYQNLGELKHVIGTRIALAGHGLLDKTVSQVAQEGKAYIDSLKSEGRLLEAASKTHDIFDKTSYAGLQYPALNIKEFREFLDYVELKTSEAEVESYPDVANQLLMLMSEDTNKFYNLLVLNAEAGDYYDVPVLQHVDPSSFVDRYLELSPTEMRTINYTFQSRYEPRATLQKLIQERNWIQVLIDLFSKKIEQMQGTLTGHKLKVLVETYLNNVISNLDSVNENQ